LIAKASYFFVTAFVADPPKLLVTVTDDGS
jgi:hypothetical protein